MRLLYYAGIAIVVVYFFIFLFNDLIMPKVTRHGQEFELPNIQGYTIAEAEQLVRPLGLEIEVTSEEYHPDKPTGTILSQIPGGGTMVKSGRTLKVVISLGQKAVEVPDLRGFSTRQAKLNLEAEGFALGDIEWTTTDSLPEKVVVFTYPSAGTMIPYGSEVNLMVNRGAHQRTVFIPRLIGLSLAEAESRLGEKGLKIGLVTHVLNENYLPETVLEQSEDAGSELLPGEEVDLVVSSLN
jgi:serine/threonine-protein kinase